MKALKFNLALLVFVCILFTSCASDDDGIYFEKLNETKVEYSEIELEILDLVNDYRVSKGLESLEKMNFISSVAEGHTYYMAETGKVNHDNFSERHEKLVSNANAKIVGENVGYGFTTAEGTSLAKQVDCTYSHVVKVLQDMQRAGLVTFEKKGRLKVLILTKKGLEIATQMDSIANAL